VDRINTPYEYKVMGHDIYRSASRDQVGYVPLLNDYSVSGGGFICLLILF
jgi:hypothetical protein